MLPAFVIHIGWLALAFILSCTVSIAIVFGAFFLSCTVSIAIVFGAFFFYLYIVESFINLYHLWLQYLHLRKMSVFVFKDRDPASACSICLEEFKGGDRYRVLPACSHSFHVACVDKWLTHSLTCPNCRKNVGMFAESNVENV